jgi:hypothetical protein
MAFTTTSKQRKTNEPTSAGEARTEERRDAYEDGVVGGVEDTLGRYGSRGRGAGGAVQRAHGVGHLHTHHREKPCEQQG